MLKILQARLQQYIYHELPDVQAGLEKAEEPEIKLPASIGSSEQQETLHQVHQDHPQEKEMKKSKMAV